MDTEPTLVTTEIKVSSIVWSCYPKGRDGERFSSNKGNALLEEIEMFFAELVKILAEKKARFESKIHPGYSFEVTLHL